MQSFVSLMYHDVCRDAAELAAQPPTVRAYSVDCRTFTDQLMEICANSRCLSWDYCRDFYEGRHLPCHPRSVVQITFDDGWLGTVDVAGPVLESLGCEALFFVTSDFVGQQGFVDRHHLQHLPPQFHVGSHARTHRMLNQLSDLEIHEELRSSKQFLEDVLGYEVDTLSFPGGAMDERVRRIAVATGYRYLFNSEVHLNTWELGPLNIGRVAIRENTPLESFRRYLYHNVGRARMRQVLLGGAKSLLGRDVYAGLRRKMLESAIRGKGG